MLATKQASCGWVIEAQVRTCPVPKFLTALSQARVTSKGTVAWTSGAQAAEELKDKDDASPATAGTLGFAPLPTKTDPKRRIGQHSRSKLQLMPRIHSVALATAEVKAEDEHDVHVPLWPGESGHPHEDASHAEHYLQFYASDSAGSLSCCFPALTLP